MVTRIGPKKPPRLYLAEWRDKFGLTQEELAMRMETTKASISRWETGKRDPTTKVLASIAHALDPDMHLENLFRDPARPSADALLKNAPQETRDTAMDVVKRIVRKDGTNG